MTNNVMFRKDLFHKVGDTLYYNGDFVARFKHRGPVTPAKLKTVLSKYYTVGEYMERVKTEAPLSILQKDGFLEFNRGALILDGKVIFPKGL